MTDNKKHDTIFQKLPVYASTAHALKKIVIELW